MDAIVERRRARLYRAGGSRSLVVPKEWLDRWQITDEVQLVLTDSGILIEPPTGEDENLDDDPRFAEFLQHLLLDAVTNPTSLTDASQMLADDKAWLDELGVE